MLSAANLRANLLVKLGELTGQTHALPLVLFAATARCNSRCVSCDWWRADGAGDLSLGEIAALAGELERAGTRAVVLTGGEPLLRPDIMAVADTFRARGMTLQLLTSGLALRRFAGEVAARFQTVRGVDGLDAVIEGVRALQARAPRVAVWARSTIHRHNFRFLPDLVARSRDMGLDQISFLAADVSSDSFNRQAGMPQVAPADALESPARLLLTAAEADEFEAVVESLIASHARDFDEQRIAPGPDGMRRLVRHYRAHLRQERFVSPMCNAPWASVLIEADGGVRPCFRRSATCASDGSRICCRRRCRHFATPWTSRRTRPAPAASVRSTSACARSCGERGQARS
jgi:Fe-coproporphyrin III synthase